MTGWWTDIPILTNALTALGYGAALITVILTALWWWSKKHQNAGIVDVFWGAGFSILGIFYAVIMDGFWQREALLLVLVLSASIRLTTYLAKRFAHEYPVEDARYNHLRQEWGSNADTLMLGVFYLQGALMLLLTSPYLLILQNPKLFIEPLEWVGSGIFITALIIETIADQQLKAFKANPNNKGQVCQEGLWHYSRHPNYFGQWMQWVGLYLVALAAPWGFWTLYAPLFMLHFLVNVTGIKPTEEQALKSRGNAYRQYQQSTSPFIPWFKAHQAKP